MQGLIEEGAKGVRLLGVVMESRVGRSSGLIAPAELPSGWGWLEGLGGGGKSKYGDSGFARMTARTNNGEKRGNEG